MSQREIVKKTLESVFVAAQIEVLDPRGDDRHLEAIVISSQFEGLSLIKQHQLVMDALKNHFNEGLHALQLKTYTPDAWNARSN